MVFANRLGGLTLSLSLLIGALGVSVAHSEVTQVKVGVLLSRTGGMADIGGWKEEQGFELAIAALKEKFEHSPYHVDFVFEDSKSAPDLAATAVNKLIRSDRVDVILGDLTSTATLAAAPIAQHAEIPLLTPSSTSDKVTQVGNFYFQGLLRRPISGYCDGQLRFYYS